MALCARRPSHNNRDGNLVRQVDLLYNKIIDNLSLFWLIFDTYENSKNSGKVEFTDFADKTKNYEILQSSLWEKNIPWIMKWKMTKVSEVLDIQTNVVLWTEKWLTDLYESEKDFWFESCEEIGKRVLIFSMGVISHKNGYEKDLVYRFI